MTGKHHAIVVFSKLLSFKSAHESVHRSLQTIIDEDECLQNRVEVIDYSEYRGRSPSFPVCTVTAVVVIDDRQTLTRITPHRRDPNVDHWDELEMLQNTITKPKGSILVVIYGDEHSKHLSKEFVSEKWKMVWKFTDELAFSLARKSRCFSVWKDFNEGQRTEIARYIQLLPLFPVYKEKTRLAVLTEGVSYTIHDDYLAYHPLLSPEIQVKERRSDGLSVHSVFDLTFDSHSERCERIEVNHKHCDDISELLQQTSSETQADKKMTDMPPCDVCVVMCQVSYYCKNETNTNDKNLRDAVAKIFHLNPSNMCCRLMPVFNDRNIDNFMDIFIPSLKRSIQNTTWQKEKLQCLDTLSMRDLQMIYGLNRCYTTNSLDCISNMCCGQCIALLGEVSEKHRTLQLFEKNLGPFNKEEVTAGQSQAVTATPYAIYRGYKLIILDFTVEENRHEHKYDENLLQQISGGKVYGSKKKPSIGSFVQKKFPFFGNFSQSKWLSTRNCAEIQAIVYVRHHGSECDESLRTILGEFRRKAVQIPIFLFYESSDQCGNLADGICTDEAKSNVDNKEQPTENVAATSAGEADGCTDNKEQPTEKVADTSAGEADGNADNKEGPTENVAATIAGEADGNADNKEESTDKVAATRAGEADGNADNKEGPTEKVAATSAGEANGCTDNKKQPTENVVAASAGEADGNADNKEGPTEKVAATRAGEADGNADNKEGPTEKVAATSVGEADDCTDEKEQPTENVAATRAGEADGNVDKKERPTEKVAATSAGEADGNVDKKERPTGKVAATSAGEADNADNKEQPTEKVADTPVGHVNADDNTQPTEKVFADDYNNYYDFVSMNFTFVLHDDPKSDENLRTLYEVLNLSKNFFDSHRT
ncbi:uncharacterized protein [Ptychodera flava]|uniref:uncharacterized protein n=1 Tax=Ptychodera flava TaxID=63121 RepID=UPI00396A1BF4